MGIGYASFPFECPCEGVWQGSVSHRPGRALRRGVSKTGHETARVELAEVFFEAFARGSQCNLHVVLHAGQNLHHITEICFKAFAKALRAATSIDARVQGVPSTKGSLDG